MNYAAIIARLIASLEPADRQTLIDSQTMRLSGPVRVIAPPISRDYAPRMRQGRQA